MAAEVSGSPPLSECVELGGDGVEGGEDTGGVWIGPGMSPEVGVLGQVLVEPLRRCAKKSALHGGRCSGAGIGS